MISWEETAGLFVIFMFRCGAVGAVKLWFMTLCTAILFTVTVRESRKYW